MAREGNPPASAPQADHGRSAPLKILVTGGGTVAAIDDVRRITNVSSGRFSSQISEACLAHGHEVWHVHAPGAQTPFARNATLDLQTDAFDSELARLKRLHAHYQTAAPRLHVTPIGDGTVGSYASTLEHLLAEVPIEVAFLAMAVSDYEPDPVSGKLDSRAEQRTVHFHRTPKVIRHVRDWAPDIFLVGFKLMSNVTESKLIEVATAACAVNRADVTLANDARLMREGRHTVHLVRPGFRPRCFEPGDDMAERVVQTVLDVRLDTLRRAEKP